MRVEIAALLGLLLISTTLSAQQNNAAAERFQSLCMSCHKLDRGPQMVAPPVFAIKNHYLRAYPDRETFIVKVSAWLRRPDPDKSLMPGALRRFNLMPQQTLAQGEPEAIAAYLYDTEFYQPGWYQEHYRQMHGDSPPQVKH